MTSVSVVIGTHKRADLLLQSLASLYKQVGNVHDMKEIIVVNDGADPDVTAVCKKFNRKVVEILKFNRREINGYCNPAMTLNLGVRHASGQVIVMQGSDIVWSDEEGLAEILAPHVSGEEKLVTNAECQKGDKLFTGAESIYFVFGAAFRRQFFMDCRGFEEGYQSWGREDDDLTWVMKAQGARLLATKARTIHLDHPVIASDAAWYLNDHDVKLFNDRRTLTFEGHLSNEDRLWGLDQK